VLADAGDDDGARRGRRGSCSTTFWGEGPPSARRRPGETLLPVVDLLPPRRGPARADPPALNASQARSTRSPRHVALRWPTSAKRTLLNSAGSMSTWMILASGAKALILPVTRSSKRAPRRDQQVAALHGGDRGVHAVHARHAEMQGVRVGEGTRAIKVVTTGMPVRSARPASASAARDLSVPPPT
jgi:hypothetical protein